MKFTTFASVLTFALAASAADHDIDVGEDGFTFSPSTISCSKGDTVTFHFYPGGHSVVSSGFDSPCMSDGIISSGTVNSNSDESDMVFRIDCPSAATYLFCSQVGHCNGGMVAAINAPTSGNTLAAYKSAAKNGPNNGPVAGVKGGTLESAAAASMSSGGSSTAAATASGTAAATAAAAAPSTPAAATGDASTSHASSVAVVVFIALVNAFLMV